MLPPTYTEDKAHRREDNPSRRFPMHPLAISASICSTGDRSGAQKSEGGPALGAAEVAGESRPRRCMSSSPASTAAKRVRPPRIPHFAPAGRRGVVNDESSPPVTKTNSPTVCVNLRHHDGGDERRHWGLPWSIRTRTNSPPMVAVGVR